MMDSLNTSVDESSVGSNGAGNLGDMLLGQSKDNKTKMLAWLVKECSIEHSRAALIVRKIEEDLWITSISALQDMLVTGMNPLQSLGLPAPTQAYIEAKILSVNCKPLKQLTLSEVESLMNGLYLGEFYGSAYRQQKINGMVLDTAANVAKLVQWGISNEAHAENIWERLQTWKKYGVQRNLFDALEDSFQTLEVSSANQVGSSSAVISQLPKVSAVHFKTDPSAPAPATSSASVHSPNTPEPNLATAQQPSATPATNASTVTTGDVAGSAHAHDDAPMWDDAVDDDGDYDKVKDSGAAETSNSAGNKKRRVSRELTALKDWSMYNPRKRSLSSPARATRSHTTSAASHVPKTAAPKKQRKQGEGAGSVAPSETTDAAALKSADRAVKLAALRRFIKRAAEGSESASAIRDSGALSEILEIVRQRDQHEKDAVWMAIIVMNNAIAKSDLSITQYLVKNGIVAAVTPLCSVEDIGLRLQALWILGNVGSDAGAHGLKEAVVIPSVVAAIVLGYQLYAKRTGAVTITREGRVDVPARYAETLWQLSTGCSMDHARTLSPCIPILVSIMSNTDASCTSFKESTNAMWNLLISHEGTIVAAAHRAELVTALVKRLRGDRVAVVQYALICLAALAEASNSDQMLALEPVLEPLQELLLQHCSGQDNEKVTLRALEVVHYICQAGMQSVCQIANVAPKIFQALFKVLQKATTRAVEPTKDMISVNAALALMNAVQYADTDELTQFVSDGVFPLALDVIRMFDRHDDVVQVTLGALRKLVLDYGVGASYCWDAVRTLAQLRESSGKKRYSEQALHNSEEAERLLELAGVL